MKKSGVGKIKSKTVLSIYIYFVIFAPPLIPKARFVIGIVTAVYLLTLTPNIFKVKRCLSDSRIYIWAVGIILFLIHMFFMLLINELLYNDTVQFSHYISLYNRFLVSLIEILPCSVCIITKMSRYDYGIDEFLTIVFGAALIEAVTVILAVISPSIKDVFNQTAAAINGISLIENKWYITVRSFGFADTLVDTFGWGTGLIAGLAFIYGVLKERKYIAVSFLLLAPPLFNARTGVIMYMLAVFVVTVYCLFRLDIARIVKVFFYIMIFIAVGAVIWKFLSEYYPATAGWIEAGLSDFAALIGNNGSKKGVSGFALVVQKKSHWELPEFPRIILGTGHSRYEAEGYRHSDFGYVNDIWAGGIFGCMILYGTGVIFTLRQLLQKKYEHCHKIMIVYLLVTLIAFNVKACAYGCNSGLVSYVLIVSFFNYFYSRKSPLFEKTDLKYLQELILH